MEFLLQGQETQRLRFRNLHTTDFDSWLPFHQNQLIARYWTIQSPDPRVACQQWFEKTFYRYENRLGGMNALIEKKSSKLIGQCGLLIQEVDGVQELEIGYSIVPFYWGHGFATEAALKCKSFAFENRLAKSLISIIHIKNVPSIKVANHIGMRLDKSTIYKGNPVNIYRTTDAAQVD